MNTITLYRPVGVKELELIATSGFTKFPPRLDWQPIFYPVLNQAYAEQIALEWNTNDEFSGYCGIVTRFYINEIHYNTYEIQNVGGEIHNELWVPAKELKTFNANIVGEIEIVNVFFGEQFVMPENEQVKIVLLKFYKNELQ